MPALIVDSTVPVASVRVELCDTAGVSAVPLPPVDSLRCFVAAADHLNFRSAATEVAHIDLLFGSSTEVLARLEQGQVDAIVTSAPLANADWDAEVLHPEAYVLVAAPELLARVPFMTPQDAAHHTILDIVGALPLLRYKRSMRIPRAWRARRSTGIDLCETST